MIPKQISYNSKTTPGIPKSIAYATFDPPKDSSNSDASSSTRTSQTNDNDSDSKDSDYKPNASEARPSPRRTKLQKQNTTTPTSNDPDSPNFKPNYRKQLHHGKPLPNNGKIVIWHWIKRWVHTNDWVEGQWWDNRGAVQIYKIKEYEGGQNGECTMKYHRTIDPNAYWREWDLDPNTLNWPRGLLNVKDFSTIGSDSETWDKSEYEDVDHRNHSSIANNNKNNTTKDHSMDTTQQNPPSNMEQSQDEDEDDSRFSQSVDKSTFT